MCVCVRVPEGGATTKTYLHEPVCGGGGANLCAQPLR